MREVLDAFWGGELVAEGADMGKRFWLVVVEDDEGYAAVVGGWGCRIWSGWHVLYIIRRLRLRRNMKIDINSERTCWGLQIMIYNILTSAPYLAPDIPLGFASQLHENRTQTP